MTNSTYIIVDVERFQEQEKSDIKSFWSSIDGVEGRHTMAQFRDALGRADATARIHLHNIPVVTEYFEQAFVTPVLRQLSAKYGDDKAALLTPAMFAIDEPDHGLSARIGEHIAAAVGV